MVPMSISSSREDAPMTDWWIYRKRSGVLIVLVSSLVLLVLLPMLLATSSTADISSTQVPRPENLPYLLSMAISKAGDTGDLQPIATATPSNIIDNNFEVFTYPWIALW